MRSVSARLIGCVLAAAVATAAGCTSAAPATRASPAPSAPPPVCGGLKILIEGAIPCERVVSIALGTLAERAPDQLRRGVTSIEVVLAECPRGEMPPQIDCAGERFAQLVTVEFGPAAPGGPIEPSLTVAVGPVSGRVLGISNPLVR